MAALSHIFFNQKHMENHGDVFDLRRLEELTRQAETRQNREEIGESF